MFKMLVVDDEVLARYAFKTLISKNFTNIELVGEAESGSQAIEMNRTLRPDIIVMDIKMPGINGIDASREIIGEFPGTNILILTAYDNFNYVQQALDIGVKGYLLKPLNKDEVVEKVNKVIKDICDHKNKVDIKQQVENKINVVRPFIEKELVSAFISGNVEISEIKSYINFLQEKIEAGYFMLITFGANYTTHINDSVRNRIYRDKVYDVILKYMPLMKKCILGNPIGNVIVVFFPLEPGFSRGSILNESLVISQEIKRKIKVITALDTAIGIGEAWGTIEKLKKSYDQANHALRIAGRNNGIVHYASLENKYDEDAVVYPLQLENELVEQLRIGNIHVAKELADDIISHVFNNNFNIMLIKEYVGQFITILKRTLLQLGIGTSALANTGALTELNGLFELDELKIWCKNNVFSIIELVGPIKQNRDKGTLKKVVDYINRQFCKDITLEMVAEEAGLSPQYLSKVFKEEFGKNFIDYVTEKRIDFAKGLLKSDVKSIKEISNTAGYVDANYFCRIFKKVTGMTPREYRDKI